MTHVRWLDLDVFIVKNIDEMSVECGITRWSMLDISLEDKGKGAILMTILAEKKCVPCQGGVAPLKGDQLTQRMKRLGPGWNLIDEKNIEKTWSFDDFRKTWNFVSQVAELADEENHHPYVCFTYGQATVTLWTHKIGGVHDNDFILAAKIDQIRHSEQ